MELPLNRSTLDFNIQRNLSITSPHLQGTRQGSHKLQIWFEICLGYIYYNKYNQNLWQRYESKRFQQAFFLCLIRATRVGVGVGVGSSILCNRFHIMCMSSYSQELTSFCNLKSPATQDHHSIICPKHHFFKYDPYLNFNPKPKTRF